MNILYFKLFKVMNKLKKFFFFFFFSIKFPRKYLNVKLFIIFSLILILLFISSTNTINIYILIQNE